MRTPSHTYITYICSGLVTTNVYNGCYVYPSKCQAERFPVSVERYSLDFEIFISSVSGGYFHFAQVLVQQQGLRTYKTPSLTLLSTFIPPNVLLFISFFHRAFISLVFVQLSS